MTKRLRDLSIKSSYPLLNKESRAYIDNFCFGPKLTKSSTVSPFSNFPFTYSSHSIMNYLKLLIRRMYQCCWCSIGMITLSITKMSYFFLVYMYLTKGSSFSNSYLYFCLYSSLTGDMGSPSIAYFSPSSPVPFIFLISLIPIFVKALQISLSFYKLQNAFLFPSKCLYILPKFDDIYVVKI